MKPEGTWLRIQALVDGQLSKAEARKLEAQLRHDPAAAGMRRQLAEIKRAMRTQPMPAEVPIPRAVYWSEIERRIRAQRNAASIHDSWWAVGTAWWRWPATAAAALLILLLGLNWPTGPRPGDAGYLSVGHEVETPLQEMNSFTFRSESELMTVVWVDPGGAHGLKLID